MALNGYGRANVSGGKSIAQLKGVFLDREVVERAIGKAKVKALSRFGAMVRRVAQTSMRYRKSPSAPGQPPSAHKSKRLAALKKMRRARYNGALLREMLFFAFDPLTRTVVVGPLGFRGSPVPALHEYGGTRRGRPGEYMVIASGRWRRVNGAKVRDVTVVSLAGKTLRYPPRPYMNPALKKASAKFAESFRGTVSR